MLAHVLLSIRFGSAWGPAIPDRPTDPAKYGLIHGAPSSSPAAGSVQAPRRMTRASTSISTSRYSRRLCGGRRSHAAGSVHIALTRVTSAFLIAPQLG